MTLYHKVVEVRKIHVDLVEWLYGKGYYCGKFQITREMWATKQDAVSFVAGLLPYPYKVTDIYCTIRPENV